ncbi:MAG: hypothetical protein LBJ20_08110 [Candidatus Methanoplasma sp.]|jgi:hypothetical protein|nr:hypothetical protein [Candidatus Methanoplasma sp.]
MGPRKPIYVSTFLLSVLAVCAGINGRQADLMMPGILSVILSVVILYKSFRGNSIKLWIPVTLNIFLIIGICGTSFADFSGFAVATPLFVALGACIVLCMVAYTEIKLDRVMFCTYFLFMTLAVSNVFSYGVYYFYLKYGVADEAQANFWLDDEFAFALTFCVLAIIAVMMYMKRKDIRLIQSDILLEVRHGTK